ncbi:DNA N-6-adenine-methyltransferase [Clostridium botulinum]|uniref:DNA N-6-adenine-methyltransferase n=1 Tax=Clostridium botulinum TaxID=1491 RepID=UPI0006A72397|nr:DNA N-6-adenine-methyltransferase [Clostridium botulinum]KAI3349051.1 phage N-6-adenine-methyltransferase [Clostridium botulinum]KOM88028.1 adenine methyltransferase [Clostridium botulinum]KOR62018.1 adenine methyltransferase [Clostridium botulinum]MBY7023649.1 adenine methyltransferase [Clostridium botulinum]NFR78603.1 adenine methyltransferase [Clostridium botulinum]
MKINTELMFSSKTDMWSTPQEFYNKLNEEFNFNLDPCSTHENAKCEKHFTLVEDGLKQNWAGSTVFCNPPYGRVLKDWVKKCYEESKKPNTRVVMLIPARTDTTYFHSYIYKKVREIRFIRGRLKFGDCKNAAPFPSMVVVF